MATNKLKVRSKPPFLNSELVVFYDAAADHPKENFEQVTRRVLPHGFGEFDCGIQECDLKDETRVRHRLHRFLQ
jgi:hypothetical protein